MPLVRIATLPERRRPTTLAALGLVAAALFAASPAAEAQPPGRVYRIGYLATSGMTKNLARTLEVLRAVLRESGYVEGRNLAIELRAAEHKLERLSALATELISLPVDAIVVGSTEAIRAAKAASRTTPVVFIGSGDPVGLGFVASLARPGGNLTGLTWDAGPELAAKWLDLAKQAAPATSRVAALFAAPDPAKPNPYRASMEAAARQLRLTLHWTDLRRPEDFPAAFAAIEPARPDALVWCFSALPDQPVLDFAARHRLPTVCCWRGAVAAGALMSYAPDWWDLVRRAATYVAKILGGAKPADLPVEQPTKFELVINLRTAKALGLTVPPAVLARADEVIE